MKVVDPNDPELVDRTGKSCLATTNPVDRCVYLSNEVRGTLFSRVLIHELGHCTMVSYNLLDEIHRMVMPEYWIEAEEYICNIIADYGLQIFDTGCQLFGESALLYVPSALEKFIA